MIGNKRLRLARDFVYSVAENAYQTPTRTVELILSSEDREEGSTVTNATINIEPAVSGVVSAEFGWFSFYNTIPNVTTSTQVLGFLSTAVYAPTNVTFEQGYWTTGEGTLTAADYALAPTSNLSDIRYEIFRQTPAGLVTSVTVSPVTGKLNIEFDAAAVGVTFTGQNTSNSWTGLVASDAAGVSWTGSNLMNLGMPMSLALASTNFTKHGVLKGNEKKTLSWFTLVPLSAGFGSLEYYEPYNPIQFHLSENQLLNRFNLQLRNPETGNEMAGFTETLNPWRLMLRLRVSDSH